MKCSQLQHMRDMRRGLCEAGDTTSSLANKSCPRFSILQRERGERGGWQSEGLISAAELRDQHGEHHIHRPLTAADQSSFVFPGHFTGDVGPSTLAVPREVSRVCQRPISLSFPCVLSGSIQNTSYHLHFAS